MAKRKRIAGNMAPASGHNVEEEVAVPVRATHFSVLANGNLASRTHVVSITEDEIPSPDFHAQSPTFYYDPSAILPSLGNEFRPLADDALWTDPEYQVYLENIAPLGPQPERSKKLSDFPMLEWLEEREVFLSEFIRLESRGLSTSPSYCPCCATDGCLPRYRCQECDGSELVCKECILTKHQRLGLHWIEKWNDDVGYFERISLKSLGHCFQLGHLFGESCAAPEVAYANSFLVVHTNGIHEVGVKFCGCGASQPHFIQLLRFGWFPATVKFPRTASTFQVLKYYQLLSFESKASAFEFYNTLHRLTDNTGTLQLRTRYPEFLRTVKQFRHIKMMKRAGRGHSRTGAAGTQEKECAVICPACPQPGINLPSGWENCPPHQRFIYSLFLAIDANFRLKRKMVSSDSTDPSLSEGWAYFVNEKKYKAFLDAYGKIIVQEPSKCSNHDAVNKERGKEGLAASGVGTVDCSRHDMKRPTSVGDLQKGERYVNMDFLFFSSIQDNQLTELVVSYDIACQWSVHLWDRMGKYPLWMHVDHDDRTTLRFLIPKFHLPAHIHACQSTFSFNFNRNVGRSDGEGVERGWSNINPISASTREMGPGTRRDTLDDHFGDWNWKKTTLMAPLMLRRIKEAVLQMVEHTTLHEQFSKGLPPEDVQKWAAELDAWERNHDLANPFHTRFKALSQSSIRNQLALQEEDDMKKGAAYVMHEEVSASQLVSMGLDLEEQQRRLTAAAKALSQHATDDQKSKLKLRSNALRRKIDAWIEIQQLYIPGLRLVRSQASSQAAEESRPDTSPEDIPLHLPSSLSSRVGCDRRLLEIEWKLRHAQCMDALDDLREAIRLRSYVYIDKTRFQIGQRANTRSRGILTRIEGNLFQAANRYRVGRSALVGLSKHLDKVGWQETLRVLRNEDIVALPTNDPNSKETRKKRKRSEKLESEGRRSVSWIWRSLNEDLTLSANEGLHDSLRIEWCKSKARKDRWTEEVQLLQEEMRRVLATFEHFAQVWEARARDAQGWSLPGVAADVHVDEGRASYAFGQAAQFRRMHSFSAHVWRHVAQFIKLGGVGITLVGEEKAACGDD